MVAFDRPHGMTPPQSQWELPFFGEHHRTLALGLADWAGAHATSTTAAITVTAVIFRIPRFIPSPRFATSMPVARWLRRRHDRGLRGPAS